MSVTVGRAGPRTTLKPTGTSPPRQALLKEAKERKPLVDKLNELSGSLLDLVPWHAREGLDKLVTADNERYRALSDAVTQHVDRINADMLKSQQVRPPHLGSSSV